MTNRAQVFWDKQAKRFDKSDLLSDKETSELISRTRYYLDPGDNVLDYGCATGTKTLELAKSVKHIHGLDISNEMISIAEKKKETLNVKNVSFFQGTVYDEVFEKAYFEKVIAFAIIHLLEDYEKAIQRIHELLKPGGLFISATTCFKEKMNNKTRIISALLRFLKRTGLFPLHLNLFKASDLEQLLISQNFDLVKSESLFFNGMTISYIVARKRVT